MAPVTKKIETLAANIQAMTAASGRFIKPLIENSHRLVMNRKQE
jgi:hypothetical protein